MAGLNATALNAIVAADGTKWLPDKMALYVGDPGSGTNAAGGTEVAGGAYARQAVTWGAPAGGAVAGTIPAFSIPAGTTGISHAGYFRGTTYLGCRALDAVQNFPTQGTLTVAASETHT